MHREAATRHGRRDGHALGYDVRAHRDVGGAPHRSLTSHELPRGLRQIPYDIPGDPELAAALASHADGRDDTWILACDDPFLPIQYGTVNVWSFLRRAGDVDVGGDQPMRRHAGLLAPGGVAGQGDRRSGPPRRSPGLRWDVAPFPAVPGAARSRIEPLERRQAGVRGADQRVLAMLSEGITPGCSSGCPSTDARPRGQVRSLADRARRDRWRLVPSARRALQRVRGVGGHGPGPRVVRRPADGRDRIQG